MKVKTFKKINAVLFILLFIASAYLFFLEHAEVSFLAVGFYLVIVSLLRMKVDGVLVDERQVTVSQQAAQTSFTILMPILLLTSMGLIMGGGDHNFYYVKALGIVLSYVTCLGIVIYALTYKYFDKKTGGK